MELTQGWPHFKLNMMNNIFYNLSMNWEKYAFHWENRILNPLEILHLPQTF